MKTYEAPPGFVLNPDYLVPELRAQRDALLEALRYISKYTGEGSMYNTPWQDIVADLGQKARAAIAAVEGEKK